MRRCEVRVRQMKDCANLARATGDELLRQRCQGQITELNKYYRELAGKAGIGAEYRRTYVAGFRDVKLDSTKVAQERERLKSSYSNSVSLKALDALGYQEKFSGITNNAAVNQTLYTCATRALEHRSGTNGEDLFLINGITGELLHANTLSTSRQSVQYDAATLSAIEKAHEKNIPIVALHNHPNGMPPSLDDGASAKAHGYATGVVVGHNLEVFSYSAADKVYDSGSCKQVHEALSRRIGFEFDFDEEIWYNVLNRFGMEVQRQ